MNISKDDQLLISQILDRVKLSERRNEMTFTCFLDERQYCLVSSILKSRNISFDEIRFCSLSERVVLVFGKKESDLLPVVGFHFSHTGKITHRDVLGTLFSLGLKQEVLGDIFAEKNDVFFTVLRPVKSVVQSQFLKVKKERVVLDEVTNFLLRESHFVELTILIPSRRIDVLLSKLLHLSRNAIDGLIKQKKVLCDYEEVKRSSQIISDNAVISIRGYGKFRVIREVGKTKKEKISLLVYQYR